MKAQKDVFEVELKEIFSFMEGCSLKSFDSSGHRHLFAYGSVQLNALPHFSLTQEENGC